MEMITKMLMCYAEEFYHRAAMHPVTRIFPANLRKFVIQCIPIIQEAFYEGRLRIQTVDASQGGEADIVILSFVRCNPQDVVGFVAQVNRLCVATSRAREALFLVGSRGVLENIPAIDIALRSVAFDQSSAQYFRNQAGREQSRASDTSGAADLVGMAATAEVPINETSALTAAQIEVQNARRQEDDFM
jgi:hypothetical protein